MVTVIITKIFGRLTVLVVGQVETGIGILIYLKEAGVVIVQILGCVNMVNAVIAVHVLLQFMFVVS